MFKRLSGMHVGEALHLLGEIQRWIFGTIIILSIYKYTYMFVYIYIDTNIHLYSSVLFSVELI